MRPVLGVAVLAVAGLLAACSGGSTDGPVDPAGRPSAAAIVVAAASDLRPAFEELGATFTAETGTRVTFDFGSSGQLAQRVIEGAPVDLFAAANAAYVDRVLAAGIGEAGTRRTYAVGRLVIWSTEDRWAGWQRPADLAADDRIAHLAIANPEHAPYGLAAEQALTADGAHERLRDRLVFGENVTDTQRLVESGNADVGIIALSLALAADARGVGTWAAVDEELHAPLHQDLVVTSADADRAVAARRFADLVDSEAGRAVMRRYGFLLPGEETT